MRRVEIYADDRTVASGLAGGAVEGRPPERALGVEALVVFVVVAAGHAIGQVIVYHLNNVPSVGVTFFPGDGVTVAALLLVRKRLIPVALTATFLTELASHFILGEAIVTAFGLSFANTVGPALSAYLIWRVLGRAPRLDRRHDLFAFVVAGVFAGPLLESVVGPAFARVQATHGSLAATMARWGTGDALGVLIVGGLILTWATEPKLPARTRSRAVEAAVLGVVLVAVSWLTFWRWSPSPVYLTIPLLVWAALRFGARGAMTAGVIVAAFAEWATVDGHGPFIALAGQNREAGLWLLQLFLAVIILTALLLASQVGELTDALISVESSEEQYRGIFDATTDGLVINELRSGAVVEVNPAFCAMHGYSRDELIGAQPTLFVHPDDHRLLLDYLDTVQHGLEFRGPARDVTKDGRVFDVEVRGRELRFRGRAHVLGVVRDVSEEAAAYHLLEDRVADRTRELSGLLAVAVRLAGVTTVADITTVLNEEAPQVLTRSRFAVWQVTDSHLTMAGHDGRGVSVALEQLPLTLRLLRAGGLVRCRGLDVDPDLFAELTSTGVASPDAEGVLGVALIGAGALLGMLAVERENAPRYTSEELTVAQGLASHTAIALANATLFERAQTLAAGEARQNIARDLHDSVSQTLFSTTLHAKASQLALRNAGLADDHPAAEAIADVADLTRGALAEMRALIFELRPGALAEEGLVSAVSKHAGALSAREGLQVDVVGPTARLALNAAAEEQIYRLIQEALYNVAKHSRTDTASVVIAHDDGRITITIRDEGVGFDPATPRPGHVGLSSMRERAANVGAQLTLSSQPGKGTTVHLSIPIQPAATDDGQ